MLEKNQPVSVLVTYLRVVLTEWAESGLWQERAAALLNVIPKQHAHELLIRIMKSEVSVVMAVA